MKFFHRRKDELFPRSDEDVRLLDVHPDAETGFAENDTALKFRVNETLEGMIDDACALLDVSASDFLRQILFIHLYGRYRFLGMVQRHPKFLQERDKGLVLSQGLPGLCAARPNNIADFKVWLPSRMKEELQLLAEVGEKPLSRYVREIVTLHLTGHADKIKPAKIPAPRTPRKRQTKAK